MVPPSYEAEKVIGVPEKMPISILVFKGERTIVPFHLARDRDLSLDRSKPRRPVQNGFVGVQMKIQKGVV